ncbi:MAG TPA: glycosyltransferase [Haloplasmataceae bacterium]
MRFRKWLLVDGVSQYGVLNDFTASVAASLEELGFEAKMVPGLVNTLATLVQEEKPDVLFAFNGMQNVWEDGVDLFDRLEVLSVAWLVDDPRYHMGRFLNPASRYLRLVCIDRAHVNWLKDKQGLTALFLPHAGDARYLTSVDRNRPIDVFFAGTFTTPINIQKEAQQKMSKTIYLLFCDLIDIYQYGIDFEETLTAILNARFIHGINESEFRVLRDFLWMWVDRYLRNAQREKMLKSLPKNARIVVSGKGEWEAVLADFPDVVILPPLSFPDLISLMQQSKVVVNLSSFHTDGSHERIYYALIAGAAVITNPSPFLREVFKDGEHVVYYDPEAPMLDEIICSLNETYRLLMAEQGQRFVLANHTWKHRLGSLIEWLKCVHN